MKLRDFFILDLSRTEKLLLVLLALTSLLILFRSDEEMSTVEEPVVADSTFNAYPLIAWHSSDKRGDIVKIKYRVTEPDTRIWIYGEDGNVVHTQPFHRSPWDDGRFRDFTYHWMLYRTEYGPDIPPGDYRITVCVAFKRNVELSTWITI